MAGNTKICLTVFVISILIGFNEIRGQSCEDIQDWCGTVDRRFCQTVPSMKQMCPKTCDSCLPPECSECAQNCTLLSDGKHKCGCYEGFRLLPDGKSCNDIDECDEDRDICKNNKNGEVCVNGVGDHQCTEGVCQAFSAEEFINYYERPADCCKMTFGKCGQSSANDGRIIDGKDATFKRWPWQALILLGSNLCGGTLINDLWVVSAAHCFASITNVRRERVMVRLGVHKTGDIQNPNILIRRVVKLVKHDKYRFPLNDIALLKLKSKVVFSDFISPICMPNGEVPTTGTKCFVTGYGVTVVGGGAARVLQEADVPIVDGEKCKEAYKDEEEINTSRMICAGREEGGKDACQGDSGGPLVCQRCNNCDFYLAGVTSFGAGCGDAGFYGVYTHVEFFEKWIEANVEKTVTIKKRKCSPIAWTKWGGWGKCGKSCDGGTQSRLRICRGGEVGLPGCLGKAVESQVCNIQPCKDTPKDSWTDWTDCSLTCGGGKRTRRRICVTNTCTETTREQDCNSQECPRWTRWSGWSQCCGDEDQSRTRRCLNGEIGDEGCMGQSSQSRTCTAGPCATWEEWGSWSNCKVTCGGGLQTATRECKGGVGGMDCPGSSTKSRRCGTSSCPVAFESWGRWTKCSAGCGGGDQTRTRTCSVANCEPDEFGSITRQKRACNEQDCVGEWTMWSPWDECSETCGPGTRRRIRSCHGGTKCPGTDTDREACNVRNCPGEWSSWSSWDRCSMTCGPGKRSRTRTCEGGDDCEGRRKQEEDCTVEECPIWSEWSVWEDCTASCDGGRRTRTRTCRKGNSEAEGCPGSATQSEACGTQECEIECSDICQQQVVWGYCRTRPLWMFNRCESDCCKGKFCQDRSGECDLHFCKDASRYTSCLRTCGYCP